MITLHKYEGKNLEILKEQCLNELNETEANVYFYQSEVEMGLFKGKKITLESITKEEIKSYIKDFIKNLSEKLNVSINCEIRMNEQNIEVMLLSDNNNIIIGKDGRTLNSIQILLRQAMKELNKFNLRIMVDASNYKNKKIINLEKEIRKICKEVIKTKVEVKLDPMNSYERRLVHSIVNEFENLKSESFGENPNRYTVIKIEK